MAFIIAAGFAASRTTALSSATPCVARAHSAPQMQQMGIRQGYDCLLSRISSGICDNAAPHHRLDLERLGRRADAECRVQDTLTGLTERIAGQTPVGPVSAFADSVSGTSY